METLILSPNDNFPLNSKKRIFPDASNNIFSFTSLLPSSGFAYRPISNETSTLTAKRNRISPEASSTFLQNDENIVPQSSFAPRQPFDFTNANSHLFDFEENNNFTPLKPATNIFDPTPGKRLRVVDNSNTNIPKTTGFTSNLNNSTSMPTPVANFQRHIEATQKFHESHITALKVEHQIEISEKDQQISKLTKGCKQLAENNQRLEESIKSLSEDNKVLKRAVGIQDSKIKDLTAQNQQLQAILPQISTHIANLERQNEELKNYIRLIESNGRHSSSSPNSPFNSFLPPPPPDVF